VTFFKARLATCLFDVGRDDAARRLADEARAAIMRPRERELPMSIISCRRLADLLARMQDVEQAAALLRRGLAIAERLPPDPEALHCALSLAGILVAQQRDAECEQLLRGIVSSAENSVLAEHPLIAACRRSWSAALQRLGRTAEAETQLLAAHTMLMNRFGSDDRQVQSIAADLAAFYEQSGNSERADQFRNARPDERKAGDRPLETGD
jgi:hypothetical protein